MFKWLIFSDFAATVLLRDFITEARTALTAYASEEAAALVARLCEALLGVSSYAHVVYPDLEIPEASLPVLQAAFGRLVAGEPLQYILGYTDFLGMRLRVSPAVLIPRPETEELCQRVITTYGTRLTPAPSTPASGTRLTPASSTPASGTRPVPVSSRPEQGAAGYTAPRAILDLCCGSGCITWAMAQAFPEAFVVGVDLSAAALEVARNQRVALSSNSSPSPVVSVPSSAPFTPTSGTRLTPSSSFGHTPTFLQADVLDVAVLSETLQALLAGHGISSFDLLLSNPPYVRESERAVMSRQVLDFEPAAALFVPDADPLLFYRAAARVFASSLFTSGSLAAFELNEALGEEAVSLFEKGNATVDLQKDVFGKNRFLFIKR